MSDDLDRESRLPEHLNDWQGVHAEIFADTTRELDVEGARMCAKTTLLLDKEIHYLKKYPGIHSFMCRYTDLATRTKLKPRFEALCRIRRFTDYHWNDDEMVYEFSNSSKMYAFGLKAANKAERYEKIRGQDLSRVYNDQTESTPKDIGEELRASLRQKGFPHQLTFSPNPVPSNHWLADGRHGGFPEDNSIAHRRYYRLSLDDNAYNLNPDDIEAMKRTYPPEHAKHGAMILGRRGVLVIGDPVFEDTFNRALHVRELRIDPSAPLLECFDFGKHNQCWIVAQRFHSGGIGFLGGIVGRNLFLEDFVPIVLEYRDEWFGDHPQPFRTCCPPPGAMPTNGTRFTNLTILHRSGFKPAYRENANAADVRLASLEQIASYMRRRTISGHEAFGIHNDAGRWLEASRLGIERVPFMAQAFEAGIVWDEHLRSVSNNPVRQIKDDDWFANVARTASNIELNFCANRPTQEEAEKRAVNMRQRWISPISSSNPDSWMA